MNLAILHLHTPEIAHYGQLSLANKQAYGERWGHDVLWHDHSLCLTRPPSWSKIPFVLSAIDRYDWLWWLDADAIITDPLIDIATFIHPDADVIVGQDWNGINCGSMLLRCGNATEKFLQAAWERTEYIHHNTWEQAAIQAVLSERPNMVRQRVIHHTAFNAYPTHQVFSDPFVLHYPTIPGPLREAQMRRDLNKYLTPVLA